MNYLGIILILGGFGANVRGALVESPSVDGGKAQGHNFPYQVSIRSTPYFNTLVCSGSILNEYWILTAGHCLIGKSPNDFLISAGTDYLDYPGYIYVPYLFVIHENYSSSYDNDIGMVGVGKEIIFNDFVQPIALAKEDLHDWGYKATFADWEKMQDGEVVPSTLMEFEFWNWPIGSCQNVLPFVSDSHICAFSYADLTACIGESGGPLVLDGDQVGIALELESSEPSIQNVFTRVFFYKDWIQNTMERYSNYIG